MGHHKAEQHNPQEAEFMVGKNNTAQEKKTEPPTKEVKEAGTAAKGKLQSRLHALRTAGGGAWGDLRTGFGTAGKHVRSGLGTAVGQIRSSVKKAANRFETVLKT